MIFPILRKLIVKQMRRTRDIANIYETNKALLHFQERGYSYKLKSVEMKATPQRIDLEFTLEVFLEEKKQACKIYAFPKVGK